MEHEQEGPGYSGLRLIRGEKPPAQPEESLPPPVVPASPRFTITIPWNSVTFFKVVLFACGVLVGAMLDHSENNTLFIGLDDVLLGAATVVIFKLVVEESIPKKFREDADPDWEDGVD